MCQSLTRKYTFINTGKNKFQVTIPDCFVIKLSHYTKTFFYKPKTELDINAVPAPWCNLQIK
jgi:hypothetical protein